VQRNLGIGRRCAGRRSPGSTCSAGKLEKLRFTRLLEHCHRPACDMLLGPLSKDPGPPCPLSSTVAPLYRTPACLKPLASWTRILAAPTYTQSRPTLPLFHHALLALSPAHSAIPPSDHVPADLSGMPCTSSTHRSHSRSSTDIGPLPMPFPVHHPACTMPWTVSALQTSDPLRSLRHSGSSPASESSPIQPAPPGRCSDDPVKRSFSGFPALHVLPGLLRPAHRLPMPRLRCTWLPMTIGDSLVPPERTPVRPFGLGGPGLP
jgi:hypothetical protein